MFLLLESEKIKDKYQVRMKIPVPGRYTSERRWITIFYNQIQINTIEINDCLKILLPPGKLYTAPVDRILTQTCKKYVIILHSSEIQADIKGLLMRSLFSHFWLFYFQLHLDF